LKTGKAGFLHSETPKAFSKAVTLNQHMFTSIQTLHHHMQYC